jgi:hypothetical protein
MTFNKLSIALGFALVGWALCAATMGIGMAFTSMENTLVIHAMAAPVFFFILSLLYFKWFHFTSPVQTALLFVGFVIIVDIFVVALLINKSLDMFASVLGTWIPFMLIFTSTYLAGLISIKMTKENGKA